MTVVTCPAMNSSSTVSRSSYSVSRSPSCSLVTIRSVIRSSPGVRRRTSMTSSSRSYSSAREELTSSGPSPTLAATSVSSWSLSRSDSGTPISSEMTSRGSG
ncbi:hypothetical protein [Nonomuraea dietziae]|uniref:hypothetical protein n=1 Tax=Nonomuraea dietziae TaxID=65515 RepID=UPI003CD09236